MLLEAFLYTHTLLNEKYWYITEQNIKFPLHSDFLKKSWTEKRQYSALLNGEGKELEH